MARRRGQGEGAIYKTADGRWRAAVDLGWQDGKRQRRYVSGRTREEVATRLRKAQAQVDAGLPLPSGRPMTFGAWLELWLTTVARDRVRPTTLQGYENYARGRVIPALGGHRLDKLRAEHLEAFYRSLIEDGLSPTTVLQAHRIISRALKIAQRREYVAANVATLVEPPKATRLEINPPDEDQARALLKAAKGTRNEPRWGIALCGLRQGEALGLRWADLDLDEGTLRVRQALQRLRGQGLVMAEPKSRAGRRSVPLPPSLVESLRAHRTAQVAERLAAGSEWQEHDLVFAQPNGRPIEPSADNKAFKALLKAAGLPAFRLHDLRHCFATMLLASGVSPRVAMELLGHSQVSLTLNTYSHVGPKLSREASDRVEAALWA